MRRLGIAPADVEVIVLSHGHWDHVTGMEGLVGRLGRTKLPVMIHPEFWNRRRVRFPGLEPAELPATSRSALEDLGFSIVEDRRPSFLLDGAVLISEEVDRTTDFETGFQGHEALRDGQWQADPLILDGSGARRPPPRPRAGGSEWLWTRRHRQYRSIRAQARWKRSRRRDHRWISPQRSDVRTDHRAHGGRPWRPVAGACGPRPLHGMKGGPSTRNALSGRVRHEHCRHHDRALITKPPVPTAVRDATQAHDPMRSLPAIAQRWHELGPPSARREIVRAIATCWNSEEAPDGDRSRV
jgi:hypothetical protein